MPVDCVHTGSGTDYRVGPDQPYATVGAVPWESLNPGDTVRVFYRAEPYREKVIIARSGTAQSPIRVCGVPGPQGQLPILSANGATTRAQLASLFGTYREYSMQQRAIIVVWAPTYEGVVQHVHIEGLQFQDVMHAPYTGTDMNTFVDADGSVRPYDNGAAGIRVQRARDLVIRGNSFVRNPVGLYIISQSFAENHMVRNVLIEGNSFANNGLLNDYNKHQAYIQGTNFTVQYNYFGQLTPGAQANNLKMRTAGDLVRYNYFENGARAIDMVDIEDYVDLVMPWKYAEQSGRTPSSDALQAADWEAYQRSHVYGNLFHIHGDEAWPNPIHYGFDNSPHDRRPGTLWFYFNTLVYQVDRTKLSAVTMFDCCSDFGDDFYGATVAVLVGDEWRYKPTGINQPMHLHSGTTWPRMEAFNNAIYLTSATTGADPSFWQFTRWRADQVALGRNWISTSWNDPAAANATGNPTPGFGFRQIGNNIVYPGGDAAHHVTGTQNLVTGADAPVDSGTFAPTANSPLRNQAQAMPSGVPSSLWPTYQVRLVPGTPGRLQISARTSLTTLGANE
ncbi:MAG TPA: NosD domain-containing protein [Albitalea sp.]|nr:NosD domain-containing protein [Albitalea sp.]